MTRWVRVEGKWVPAVHDFLAAPHPAEPMAYCESCQNVGMSNCSDFVNCGGPRCITCKQPLTSPQPAEPQECGCCGRSDGCDPDCDAARPAEPVKERPETTSEHIARDIREGRFPKKSERQTVPADPVKVPSDAELIALADEVVDGITDEQRRLYAHLWVELCRLAIARYGQPDDPVEDTFSSE